MAKRGRKSIAEERRAQILDAFHKCAVRYGLGKASLREVATEADLPASILHHYFKNRDEMVAELHKQIMARIMEDLRVDALGAKDPQKRVKKALDFLFTPKAQKLEDGSLYYDFWSLAHRSDAVRQTLHSHVRNQRKEFVRVFSEAGQFSDLSKAEIREISNIMIAIVEGTFYVLDMDGENVSPKRMARLTMRFLELYAEDKRQEKRKKGDAPKCL